MVRAVKKAMKKLDVLEQFRQDCEFWQEKLNLMDYDLTVQQESIDDSGRRLKSMACVSTYVEARLITITLAADIAEYEDFDSKAEALHEMLHVRFAEMMESVLRERTTYCEVVNSAEHSIIKVLVRLLCKS